MDDQKKTLNLGKCRTPEEKLQAVKAFAEFLKSNLKDGEGMSYDSSVAACDLLIDIVDGKKSKKG